MWFERKISPEDVKKPFSLLERHISAIRIGNGAIPEIPYRPEIVPDPDWLQYSSIAITSSSLHQARLSSRVQTRFDHCCRELELLKAQFVSTSLHFRIPFQQVSTAECDRTFIYRLQYILRFQDRLYLDIPLTLQTCTWESRRRLRHFYMELAQLGSSERAKPPVLLFRLPILMIDGHHYCPLNIGAMEEICSLMRDVKLLGYDCGFVCDQNIEFEWAITSSLEKKSSVESVLEELFTDEITELGEIQQLFYLLGQVELGKGERVQELATLLLGLHQKKEKLEKIYPLNELASIFLYSRSITEAVLKKRGEKIPVSFSQLHLN